MKYYEEGTEGAFTSTDIMGNSGKKSLYKAAIS